MKLLVLADDLTGALDTGIQFVAGRAATRVLLDPCYPLEKVDPSVQVLVVCGSVNPITVAQMEETSRCGFRHIHLTARQLLTSDYFEGPEGQSLLDQWAAWLKAGKNCVLDSTPASGDGETATQVGEEMGMELENLRQHISHTLGHVLRQLVERGVRSTMLVAGGDALMGFVLAAGISEIVPVREFLTGSVLSLVNVGGTTYNIISKSGGFGERTLVSDLARLVLPREETNGEHG